MMGLAFAAATVVGVLVGRKAGTFLGLSAFAVVLVLTGLALG